MTIINKDEACVIALKRIRQMEADAGVELMINDNNMVEGPLGWVMHYNSRKFLVDGCEFSRLAGNGPIVVFKTNGELQLLGSNISQGETLRIIGLQ